MPPASQLSDTTRRLLSPRREVSRFRRTKDLRGRAELISEISRALRIRWRCVLSDAVDSVVATCRAGVGDGSGQSHSDGGQRGGTAHTPSPPTNIAFWRGAALPHAVRDPPWIETCASTPAPVE